MVLSASIFARSVSSIFESLTRDYIRAHEEELLGLDVNQAEKGDDPGQMCFELANLGC